MGKDVEAKGEYPAAAAAAGGSVARCLHATSVVILALLLPLAFLLLARLASNPILLPFSSFLQADLLLLLSLLSGVCVGALLAAVFGGGDGDGEDAARPSTVLAWAFLCLFQLCVGLGVETSIAAGVETACAGGAAGVPDGPGWPRRVALFLGMHEATLFWVRTFVRPVVDDAVFRGAQGGAAEGRRRFEGVAVGAAFSLLWLWTLEREVDGLLSVAVWIEGGPAASGARWGTFVLWMVTNVTVVAGAVRVVKGVVWLGGLSRRRSGFQGGGGVGERAPLWDYSDHTACEV